jgi:hypothetical protein
VIPGDTSKPTQNIQKQVYQSMSMKKRSNSDENLMNGLGAAAGGSSGHLDALEGFGEIIEGPRASQRINLYEDSDNII